MLLTQLLTPSRIRIPIEAPDKPGVLREMVRLFVDQCGGDYADVLHAVQERETTLSTGIGFGVAIPHGKSPTVAGLGAVAGVTAQPVPFDAVDGAPVRLVFLLAGPEAEAGAHVKALSRIARLARHQRVREQLVAATTPDEFYRAIQQSETW